MSDMFTGRLKSEIPICLDFIIDSLIKQPLVDVDFSDNAFGPLSAQPFKRLVSLNKNIQIIRLNNNGLGIGGIKIISEGLAEAGQENKKNNKQSNLKEIYFGRNRLENDGIQFLSFSLMMHTNLVKVVLPQNGIRPEGIQCLMMALIKCKSLQVLDLQDNTFTNEGSFACAIALQNWKDLKVLNVGECLLGDKGSKAIISALTGSHSTIEAIYLSYNEITVRGLELIPNMLQDKPWLNILELNGNQFDAECEGVNLVREVLIEIGQPDALDELDDMEELSEDEAEEIEQEEIMEKENSIKELEESLKIMTMLESDKFSIAGQGLKLNDATQAMQISNEIISMKTIQEIEFSGNTFGVEATALISNALSHHNTIKIANLSDMFTGRLRDEIPKCLEYLVEALSKQNNLESIDLSGIFYS